MPVLPTGHLRFCSIGPDFFWIWFQLDEIGFAVFIFLFLQSTRVDRTPAFLLPDNVSYIFQSPNFLPSSFKITVGHLLSGLLYSVAYMSCLASSKNPLAMSSQNGTAFIVKTHCLAGSCSEAVEDTISSANNKEATDLSYSSLFTLLWWQSADCTIIAL